MRYALPPFCINCINMVILLEVVRPFYLIVPVVCLLFLINVQSSCEVRLNTLWAYSDSSYLISTVSCSSGQASPSLIQSKVDRKASILFWTVYLFNKWKGALKSREYWRDLPVFKPLVQKPVSVREWGDLHFWISCRLILSVWVW